LGNQVRPSDVHDFPERVCLGAPQAGGSTWGLTPWQPLPIIMLGRPPKGTAIQTFLRESVYSLCADPAHAWALRVRTPRFAYTEAEWAFGCASVIVTGFIFGGLTGVIATLGGGSGASRDKSDCHFRKNGS
jgi:hypothetical protein